MKNFIVILVTLLISGLWLFPILIKEYNAFGLLYVPICVISICWGNFLVEYIKK